MNLRPKSNRPLRPENGFDRDEKTGFFVRRRNLIVVRGMKTHRIHRERNMVYKGPIVQPEIPESAPPIPPSLA